jgi:hypothetical protein
MELNRGDGVPAETLTAMTFVASPDAAAAGFSNRGSWRFAAEGAAGNIPRRHQDGTKKFFGMNIPLLIIFGTFVTPHNVVHAGAGQSGGRG